ncbi:Serine/threonine-protein kinase, partial [Ascosphaera acerosa]
LLGKILSAKNHIRFGETIVISPEFKAFIRGLLKMDPADRMTFDEFFNHNVVVGRIPGVANPDDQVLPRGDRLQPQQQQQQSSCDAESHTARRAGIQAGTSAAAAPSREPSIPLPITGTTATSRPCSRQLLPADITADRAADRTADRTVQTGTRSPGPVHKHSADLEIEARRNAKALAAQREEERQRRLQEARVAMDIALERDYIFVEKRSVEVNSLADAFAEEMATATATPRAQHHQYQQGLASAARQGRSPLAMALFSGSGGGDDDNDAAASSHSNQQHHRRQSSNAAATSAADAADPPNPASAVGDTAAAGLPRQVSSPVAHSQALAIRPSTRPRTGSGSSTSGTLRRKASVERRFGYSPTSATKALSRALNMATGRLFGYSLSSQQSPASDRRSPYGYNPFPTVSLSNRRLTLDAENVHPRGAAGQNAGLDGKAVVDEDARILQIIEDCATRSDVVYGFAEVKFKQLLPFPPSESHRTTAASDAINNHYKDEPYLAQINGDDDDDADADAEQDDGLTDDAVVVLSEEALVLYVKTLSLLAKSMDIAGAWWVRKNMPPTPPPSLPDGSMATATATATALTSGNIVVVGNQINNVVQWVRRRFNEVLDKAEYCRKRLLSVQQRLHASQRSRGGAGASHPAPAATGAISLASGVTAEALMYARAHEMSRTAAINELTGRDLPACEIAYVTALRMLEAILETEQDQDESLLRRPASAAASPPAQRLGSGDGGGQANGLGARERAVVAELIAATRTRLTKLREKMDAAAVRQQASRSQALHRSQAQGQGQGQGLRQGQSQQLTIAAAHTSN